MPLVLNRITWYSIRAAVELIYPVVLNDRDREVLGMR